MSGKPVDVEVNDPPSHPEEMPSHPEEMKGAVELKFGKLAAMTATGRTTPAGLIGAALLVSAVLIPLVIMTRRRR
jgi:hypothetical protein